MSRPRASGTAGVGPSFGSSAHKLWLPKDAFGHITRLPPGYLQHQRAGSLPHHQQWSLCSCCPLGRWHFRFNPEAVWMWWGQAPSVTTSDSSVGAARGWWPQVVRISCCRPKPPLRLLPTFYLPVPAGTLYMFTLSMQLLPQHEEQTGTDCPRVIDA